MEIEKLKQLRGLLLEIQEEQERKYTFGAWSLFHDDSEVMEKNGKELARMNEWIECVPDCLVRRAIKLRFIDGKSWGEVSYRMGYTSPDGARKLVSRYLEKISV